MAKDQILDPTQPNTTPASSDTTANNSFVVTEDQGGASLSDKVISVDRVSRTQAGGRRIRFRALVVVGDHRGNVGIGTGKSSEVVSAVAKATAQAKKKMFTVPIVRHTIPHEIVTKFDSAKVLLKPAPAGTSVIAGSSVRPILEIAGIENVVGKCLTRTTNKYNNAYATIKALQSLKDIKEVAPRFYTKRKKQKAATPEVATQAPTSEQATAAKPKRTTKKKVA